MRISDWSSDVCSSDLCAACHSIDLVHFRDLEGIGYNKAEVKAIAAQWVIEQPTINPDTGEASTRKNLPSDPFPKPFANRSEEHTSELQSLMRISYAVFCLKQTKKNTPSNDKYTPTTSPHQRKPK